MDEIMHLQFWRGFGFWIEPLFGWAYLKSNKNECLLEIFILKDLMTRLEIESVEIGDISSFRWMMFLPTAALQYLGQGVDMGQFITFRSTPPSHRLQRFAGNVEGILKNSLPFINKGFFQSKLWILRSNGSKLVISSLFLSVTFIKLHWQDYNLNS